MISWAMTRTSLNIRALLWAVILYLLVLVHHFQNNSLFSIGLQEKEQQRSSSSNCDCSGKNSSTVESSNIHAIPGDDNINNEKAFTSTSNTSTASSIQHKPSLDTDACRDIFRTKVRRSKGSKHGCYTMIRYQSYDTTSSSTITCTCTPRMIPVLYLLLLSQQQTHHSTSFICVKNNTTHRAKVVLVK